MKACVAHAQDVPELGCVACERVYDEAVQALASHGFATPPTARTRKLATYVLQYTAEDYASGAGLTAHKQVVAALHRAARWFGYHEHGRGRR